VGKSVSIRKIRSDKKRDVKPTLSLELKDNVYRMSHLCKVPVKDIAETLCEIGIDSESVVAKLSAHFKRDVRLRSTVYCGYPYNPPVKKNSIITGRITIKFPADIYENMCLLAYTMDVTPSRAVAILLNASIKDVSISESLLRDNLKINWMSDSDRTELSILMKFIRGNRPNDDRASWTELMKFAAGEVGDFVVNGWRKE